MSSSAGSLAHAAQMRLPLLDYLRAVASQLIVLHHMAFYGPLSDYAAPLAPGVMAWFADHARMAVQTFLVIGGFLTARRLCRCQELDLEACGRLVWARYRRIGFPYLAALAVAIGANALGAQWMEHESISAPPEFWQVVAHVVLLHDILGYPALSAGIWYLAIDFQLFLLCLGAVWASQALARRHPLFASYAPISLATCAICPLALSSLFWFNRHSQYDVWAIYFVGAYFSGFLTHAVLEGRVRLGWGAAYLGVMVVAAVFDPRPRLLVAAFTAFTIYLGTREVFARWPTSRSLCYLGKTSYSLFLIHFPVLLVVNAWGASRWTTVESAALGLLLGYVLSLLASTLLYRGVEQRVQARSDGGIFREGCDSRPRANLGYNGRTGRRPC